MEGRSAREWEVRTDKGMGLREGCPESGQTADPRTNAAAAGRIGSMTHPAGSLEQRASQVLSPVLGHYTWLEVDRGEGSWLIARDGRRVLDLTSGIAVTPVGHAHPKMGAAVQARAAKAAPICSRLAAYEPNLALPHAASPGLPAGLRLGLLGQSRPHPAGAS